MTVYSYSRVNTFFTCPAQFQFRYIEKRPSPVAEGIELFLGSRFHETMEHLYRQLPQGVPTVNQLMDFFKTHWESHWKQAIQKQKDKNFSDPLRIVHEDQTVEDYYQKGQFFVENYYHQYQPFDQDRTEGIETRVAFNLDPKGEFKMQGYIDRLGVDDDGVIWIHDYKTSSRKISAEDVKSEDQLALYQIGLSQSPKYGPQAKFKLIWHFVAFEKDQVVSERNAKEISWLKDKYISKIQTIEKAKSYPTKTSVLCKWCEYLSVCAEGKSWVESRRVPTHDKKSKEVGIAPISLNTVKEDRRKEPKNAEALPEAKPVPQLAASSPTTLLAAQGDEKNLPASIESAPQTLAPIKSKKRRSFVAVSPDQLPLF